MEIFPTSDEPNIIFDIHKFVHENKKIIMKISSDKVLNKISEKYDFVVNKLIETQGTPEHKKWLLKERVLDRKGIVRRIKLGADLWGDLGQHRQHIRKDKV